MGQRHRVVEKLRSLIARKSSKYAVVGAGLIVIALIVAVVLTRGAPPRSISYGRFRSEVDGGRVATVIIVKSASSLQGELVDGSAYESTYLSEISLDRLLVTHPEIDQSVVVDNTPVWQIVIAVLIIAGLGVFVIRTTRGEHGWMSRFGRADADLVESNQKPATFRDVAGASEAIEELQEIKDFLNAPERFLRLGASIPRGVLLVGPPGTGKTLLARAVAGEANVPFLSSPGSQFVEMLVGVGAARVKSLFEQARAHAPSIIFVDEIDAVGRHRGAGLGQGHDEREQTLNQLLVEMDGFDQRTGVVVIAATNRPDILDPALMRPGRFDRHVTVDYPDVLAREQILEVHARGKPLSEEVRVDVVARRTPGFTGADLENVLNEAALLAGRRQKETIERRDIEEAIDRLLAGPERRTRVITPAEKQVIAYHEAGHALAGWVTSTGAAIHRVSIVARGRSLGHTLHLPLEERYLMRRSEMIQQLVVTLAGRVAEELVFEDPTSGAHDDLRHATALARKMVCEFGMSDKIGPVVIGHPTDQPFLGRAITDVNANGNRAEVDDEIRRLLDEAKQEAATILRQYRERLDALVTALIAHETIEREGIDTLLADVPKGSGRAGHDEDVGPQELIRSESG